MSFPPSTKISLTSAIYFKANWIFTFHPAKPGPFQTPSGEKQAQMMNMKRKFHWGKVGDYAQWAEIPYKSEDSLVIILPNKEETVESVMTKMNHRTLSDILNDIDREDSLVRLFSKCKFVPFLSISLCCRLTSISLCLSLRLKVQQAWSNHS